MLHNFYATTFQFNSIFTHNCLY
ncbi:hypothetical protein [Nitrosomonas sp.]